MLRAMDSAVAGLRAHQNKLDVIGNNIANVNTFGFKSQGYSFKDTMYQTSSTSSGGKQEASGNATIGGANPAQYGYGSLLLTLLPVHHPMWEASMLPSTDPDSL